MTLSEMNELSAAKIKETLRTRVLGRNALYFPRLDSTNRLAIDLARQGVPEGTLVLADEQTAGRGRLGRRWLAPPATSLLMSLIFYPPLAPKEASQLTMLSSLALAAAIEKVTELKVHFKWPNDLLIGGKKIGGILTETGIEEERLEYAVVGIGLNVNYEVAQVPEIASTATSLSQELGQDISRLELLGEILWQIEERYQRLREGESFHREWTAHLSALGKCVVVTTLQRVLEGWLEGIDADGALILRQTNGEMTRVLAGDMSIKKG